MSYRIPLPTGGRLKSLDVVDPSSSSVQRLLRRTGLSSYEPSTAAALFACFERRGDGFVFFDVGANIGLYAALAAAVFEPATVVAFEPTPATADIADAIARANDLQIDVVRSALSDKEGHADLHISPVSDSSNSLNADFRNGVETVRVPVMRLDEFVRQMNVSPDVIKIDVETHEAAVLRGARATLVRCRPDLVVEVLRGRRGRDFASEVNAAVAGLGYSMYELAATPSFVEEPKLFASAGENRDWLLTTKPLPADFSDRWAIWSTRLGLCAPERNSRVPVGPALRRAWDRGGTREIAATVQRVVRRRR